jgi:cytochrome c oxidase cbb3-type subunit 3
MSARRARASVVIAVLGLAVAIACRREVRNFNDMPAGQTFPAVTTLTDFHAGGPQPGPPASIPYDDNAYAMSEGKQLYSSFNCVGCHAHGGGGIGPPLMDDAWIYGSSPAQIYSTILEGRPNGMPAYAGKIPEQQAWELVAYVRSLSGLVAKDAAPNRDDAAVPGTPENRQPTHKPVQTGHR